MDFSIDKSNENFWYISKNKEEPRLASRFDEPDQLEQPLQLQEILKNFIKIIIYKNEELSKFLEENSDLRHVVRRCHIVEKLPYAEIQDNSLVQS